jgi:hypothetical protein
MKSSGGGAPGKILSMDRPQDIGLKVRAGEPLPVRIIGIDIPFWSLVNFLAKLVLAAIPAVLLVIFFVASVVFFFSQTSRFIP